VNPSGPPANADGPSPKTTDPFARNEGRVGAKNGPLRSTDGRPLENSIEVPESIDGAVYIDEVVPAVFGALLPDQMETIRAAMRYHSEGMTAQQAFNARLLPRVDWQPELLIATVGCCWDADRLDLPRVGIVPEARFMSTPSWGHVRTAGLGSYYEPSEGEDGRPLGVRQTPGCS